MMRELRLAGPLGAKFGRQHFYDLDSNTPREALAALFSQIKGAREYFNNAHTRGLGFAVFVGRRNLSKDHLTLPANDVIRIVQMPLGAKNGGVLQIIVGVVIVAVATIYGGPASGAQAAQWYSAAMGVGIAMIAGGIVQLLTPVPHGVGAKDGPDNQPNYNFNGPVNTQAQGNPVPLCYGRMKVGSAVISAGIDTLDTSTYLPGQSPGHMGGGGGCPELEVPVLAVRDGRDVEIPAGDVRVGDVLVTADPVTLERGTAVVRYSEAKLQPCVGVLLADRSLHCSESAPLPTPKGLVDAPHVSSMYVAARYADRAQWEPVMAVYGRGLRWVQHIDIDNGCFWAGGVLHHNKQATAIPGEPL